METQQLRDLRPLGVAQFLALPLTCFSLWIALGLAVGVLGVLLHLGKGQGIAELLTGTQGATAGALVTGCCGLPVPLSWLTLAAPPLLLLWVATALFWR